MMSGFLCNLFKKKKHYVTFDYVCKGCRISCLQTSEVVFDPAPVALLVLKILTSSVEHVDRKFCLILGLGLPLFK